MDERGNLFEPGPLLEWLPDETLFSLVSRLHVLWGNQSSHQTCNALFGDKHGGSYHDLPSHLSMFESRTHGLLGLATDIARQRTLLRYYRPFLSEVVEQQIVDKLCSTNVTHLKFFLGLLTSRFRANHPLKACPCCMMQDVKEYGWAYWHLTHQYPGVWLCQAHDVPLQTSTLKSTGVLRFFWHMPSKDSLRRWSDEEQSEFTKNAVCVRSLAEATITLVDQDARIAPPYLHEIYRQKLGQSGLLSLSGRLHQHEIATRFLEYASGIRFLPELNAFPETLDQAMAQVGRLLRPMRSGTHPIRYLAMIDWLFKSTDEFLASYQIASTSLGTLSDKPRGIATDFSQRPDPRREQLVSLLRAGDISMRAAAKVIGIDTATAMVWAAQQGIPTSHRAKVLKTAIRNDLVTRLQDGMDKLEAARLFGISVTTVTHVLRSEVGLHMAWETARFEKRTDYTRKAWQALVVEHGMWGTKAVRNENPAVYAWLYRNDREWLKQHLPPAVSQSRRKSSVDWDARDVELSMAVEKAALQINCHQKHRTLRLWQIYQAVPELKAKLSVLSRLPLTKMVVNRLIGREYNSAIASDLLI